jgi:hypothetical protein
VAVWPATLELRGRRCRLPERDRETPRSWVLLGRRRWAVRNGVALGVGAWSRIGFASWYAVPAGCLLVGSAPFGALLYGLYGLARSVAVLPMMAAIRSHGEIPVGDWLFSRRRLAHKVLGADLLVLAGLVVVVVGF